MAVETLGSTPKLARVFARAALSRRHSGSTLPDRTLRLEDVVVDRTNLVDYQRLCGWDVSDLLPQTYPHVLGFPLQAALMGGEGFPLPLMGLVHVENVITVHRTLTAADDLDITVRAEDLRPHAKGRQVDLVTEVTVGGDVVWEGRSTYLSRGKGDPEASRGSQPPGIPTGFPVAEWRLGSNLGRRYAAVSGDVNPIHLFGLTAKAMGFRAAIAHGMWSYARVLAGLGAVAQGPTTSQVWFRKPIFLPSTVQLVVDAAGPEVVAGLRAARNTETNHLVLTLGESAHR